MAKAQNNFVDTHSVVRKIWGKADTILLIFAGAAAEFALNKAVDWLYFTGRLPSDPLGRLFSTVAYAREIIFSSEEDAHNAIDKMTNIHAAVEHARGRNIPDEAYRDVLFMLIHYSISAYETLEHALLKEEKEEVVEVFCRVGQRMGIPGLPRDYDDWFNMYDDNISIHLVHSKFTDDLFKQYRKHLGLIRFFILIESQKIVVSQRVRQLLNFGPPLLIRPLLKAYTVSRKIKADQLLKFVLLPSLYKQRIRMLDFQPGR
ncbi:MAG TPA: oxygenase MpaB family protein [Flavitalea sp.]|nr:oxygenase MpaB family protein [Flavitalea sp.]